MKIKIDNSVSYTYKPVLLYLGKKKINIPIAKKNLQLFNTIMKKLNIPFVLVYGTLLGAIRDNGFIVHDEDVDIAINYEYFIVFVKHIHCFNGKGFQIARYDERGFISIIKDEEYIDLYFFVDNDNGLSECCNNFLLTTFIKNITQIEFYGEKYSIPQQYEMFFLLEYGKTWKTPIEYKQSNLLLYLSIVNQIIKKMLIKSVRKMFYSMMRSNKYKKYLLKVKNYETEYNCTLINMKA